MNTILLSDEFKDWLSTLRDTSGKARLLARIKSAELGNFGHWKSVGAGLLEMKVNTGPGYRVYYVRKETSVYVLLCGGNKSTQAQDIRQANAILKALFEE